MTSGIIQVSKTAEKLIRDGSTNAEIKEKLPMIKLPYLRQLREVIHNLKGTEKMSLFNRASRMIQDGKTNKEVCDALELVSFDDIGALRTLMRRFDPIVPTESEAREQRLDRITEGDNPLEHMRLLLRRGKTNAEIQEALLDKFPSMPMSQAHISQERVRRRKMGEDIPKNIDIRS